MAEAPGSDYYPMVHRSLRLTTLSDAFLTPLFSHGGCLFGWD